MDSGKLTWNAQAGLTPAKSALIGVLAAVLAAVLYIQLGRDFPGQSVAETARSRRYPRRRPIANRRKVRLLQRMCRVRNRWSAKIGSRPTWRRSSTTIRSRCLLHFRIPRRPSWRAPSPRARPRPIATPRPTEQRLEAERQQTQGEFNTLRTQGVQVIIKRGDEYVAIIGDEEVRVGDQVEGFTVLAIDADGVKVAKDLSP